MQPTLAPQTSEQRFELLAKQAQACVQCSRMEGRGGVFSKSNGSLGSRVMFVAEAPGRFGAARTCIPLCGDATGRNFDELLPYAGLSRDEVFITNAVLCNPRDAKGNNRKPTKQEVCNCQPFLRETIAIVNPEVVVSLGKVALQALANVSPHDVVLARDVGCRIAWNGRYLFPLYHPGPQVVNIHRSFETQKHDYERLAEVLKKCPHTLSSPVV